MSDNDGNMSYTNSIYLHKTLANESITLYHLWMNAGTPVGTPVGTLVGTLVGTCEVCVSEVYHATEPWYQGKTAGITSLHVEPEYRGQGFGYHLLLQVLCDLYHHGTQYVELSDASDRCGKESCIYVVMGLSYISDDNQMRGNLRHILQGRRHLHSRH